MDELQSFFEQNDLSDITFLIPGGNHGDTLIYKGAEKLVAGLGINSISLDPPSKAGYDRRLKSFGNRLLSRMNMTPFDELEVDTDTVFIHGGGNFNDMGGRGISIHYVEYLNNKLNDSTIIVGPQSYWFGSLDLSSVIDISSNDIHLFCREEYSYNILQNYNLPSNVEIYLSKDTALYLEENDLRPYQKSQEKVGTLLAFRDDRESVIRPKQKEELEEKGENVMKADLSNHQKYNFTDFISIANNANQIYTDRLHMSILGAILGKNVTLYPNRYFKNRAVYRFSLKQYGNISFQDII